MANTTVQIDVPEQVAPVTAFLTTTALGQTAANSAGYTMSLSASVGWLYTITVAEACTGIYRIECQDGDGATVAQGWVDIEADDTGTYIADASYHVLKARDEVQVVDANVDAVLADTAELQSDWTNGGRLDLLVDAILADTAELQSDWTNGGRLDVIIDAIFADTDALQGWWVDGGRLDVILDAIKAKTDTIGAVAATLQASSVATFELIRNDSYDGTANTAPTFTVTKDFTSGWTGVLTIRHRVTKSQLVQVDVTVDSATQLSAQFTSAETAFALLVSDTEFGPHPFDIQMEHTGGSKMTPVEGVVVIKQDESTS